MDNNDILIRLRYALDIRDKDMQKIFNLGGVEFTQDEVKKLLIKSKETDHHDHVAVEATNENDENLKCNNSTLEAFLNGFIIFKRGKQEPRPGLPETPEQSKQDNLNNVLLKKVKIALSLTSEDMLDIFQKAGITVTKGELSALLRKEGHKNYKECGDKYARNFLKGLAIKIRG
jgi:uncharacterized protein YehS (DUF1456 family)